MNSLTITVLGSGDYCNHGGRAQQALLLEHEGEGLLLDCGANTKAQMERLSIGYDRFQRVLITHYHGDHFGGLPYMIAELNNNPALLKEPLKIIGPGATKEHVEALTLAMGYGVGGPAVVNYIDFPPQGYSDSFADITALPMQHRPESLGYRINAAGLIVAITGDTKWCENIPLLAQNADLLIIDVNMRQGSGPHVSLEELMAHRAEISARHILAVHIADLGPNCPLHQAEDGSIWQLDVNTLKRCK